MRAELCRKAKCKVQFVWVFLWYQVLTKNVIRDVKIKATNPEPELCSNIRGLSSANIRISVHPKKMKDSHWTEPSMSILPHPFIKISYLQRIFVPCMLVTLKVFNVCQIPHKSWQVVATWKNKKLSNTRTWIKYQIFGGRNHVRMFEILEEFSKYSNIRISVAAVVKICELDINLTWSV